MTYKIFNAEGTTGEHPEGMLYRSWVSGPAGAHYELLREKQHTGIDVKKATAWLRHNFDCVSINVLKENELQEL